MSTQEVISQFQKSAIARTLAIRGSWGRGKTYLWKELLKANKSSIEFAGYSYVSLFGMNNLQDVKAAIFEKGVSPSDIGKDDVVVSFDTAISELPALAKQNLKPVTRAIFNIQTPWAGGLGSIYEAYVFSKVRRRLICFDDLERRGKGLAIEDVMGLISLLCEERRCSVALILNEETLSQPDLKVWSSYREKVFDGEVTYRPSTADCIDRVLAPAGVDAWHDEAREILMRADVSNIRIISRTRRCIDQLKKFIDSKTSESTQKALAKSAAILSYCHNAQGENSPSVEFALKHSLYIGAGEERDEKEKIWGRKLDDVNFMPTDLDALVADLVVHGYVDKEEFVRVANNLENKKSKQEADTQFNEAWDFYHNSFGDNQVELIEKFEESFPKAASIVSANNANSTMLLMRDLGRPELAEKFAHLWIESRRGERKEELSLREAEIFGKITDSFFRDSLVIAGKQEHSVPTFEQAMNIVMDRSVDPENGYEALAQAEIPEYLAWLKNTKGRQLGQAVRSILQGSPTENAVAARTKLRSAMYELSKESMIDRVKMMRYGIIDKDGNKIEEEG